MQILTYIIIGHATQFWFLFYQLSKHHELWSLIWTWYHKISWISMSIYLDLPDSFYSCTVFHYMNVIISLTNPLFMGTQILFCFLQTELPRTGLSLDTWKCLFTLTLAIMGTIDLNIISATGKNDTLLLFYYFPLIIYHVICEPEHIFIFSRAFLSLFLIIYYYYSFNLSPYGHFFFFFFDHF